MWFMNLFILALQVITIIHFVLAVSVSFKAVKPLRDVELAVGIFLAWFIPIVGSLIALRLINSRSENRVDFGTVVLPLLPYLGIMILVIYDLPR